MANSGLSEAIFLKHRSQPCGASSSGSMCVSVKKTKSNELGVLVSATKSNAAAPPSAAVTPVTAAVFRNCLRSKIMGTPSNGLQNRRNLTTTEVRVREARLPFGSLALFRRQSVLLSPPENPDSAAGIAEALLPRYAHSP